jgi:hypothetical protein
MANLTGQQICATYGNLLQIDGGQLQNGLGVPVTSIGNFSASYSTTASYSNFAGTASYIDVTGSGVLVNWFGSQLQLTASSGTGTGVTVDAAPPVGPAQGDLWWDTDDANMYMYYQYVSASATQSAWVPASSLAVQALSADSAVSASYAKTASYVDIKGSGITVNYFGSEIQLTGSGGPAVSASYALTASYFLTSSVSSASIAQTSSYYVMTNYIANEYVDDTAAAAAGIPLGGIYRSGNMVVVRIS